MVSNLFSAYFGDEVSLEEKNINLAMMICCYTMILAFIYGVYMRLPLPFFVITVLVFIAMLIVFTYSIHKGKYNEGAFVTAILINLIELPFAYYFDGRLLCPAIILYLAGVFFCIFCIEKQLLWISLLLSTASFAFSVYRMKTLHYAGRDFRINEVNMLVDVILPLAICTAYVCKALDYRKKIYEREENKVKNGRYQAEEMNRGKDLFLMNMSHEMRTPMNTIITATGLIEDKTENNTIRQSIVYLQNACNALISNIDDLLIFSKAENSEVSLSETDFDSRVLFEDIINIISVRLMDSTVDLRVFLDPEIPSVLYGDSAKIRQVFINILNNAVKYTREGYIRLDVSMSSKEEDSVVIHSVIEDTGIGIREEDMPRLFAAFERLDDRYHESMKVEGTGLGLSICKSILDSMQGSISVKSTYNKGSCFTFDIPVKTVDESKMLEVRNVRHLSVLLYEDDRERSEIAQKALKDLGILFKAVYDEKDFSEYIKKGGYTHVLISSENCSQNEEILKNINMKRVIITYINTADEIPFDSDRLIRPVDTLSLTMYFNNAGDTRNKDLKRGFTCSRARVMIIDDNRTNLFVIERLLKRYGMNTVTAQSGREALNLTGDDKFDMIFIDYMMPEMDGIDTLKKIREHSSQWCKTVPCIVLTADAADGARQMLLDAGFDDYISKPIRVERLAEAIYDLIDPELIEWVED